MKLFLFVFCLLTLNLFGQKNTSNRATSVGITGNLAMVKTKLSGYEYQVLNSEKENSFAVGPGLFVDTHLGKNIYLDCEVSYLFNSNSGSYYLYYDSTTFTGPGSNRIYGTDSSTFHETRECHNVLLNVGLSYKLLSKNRFDLKAGIGFSANLTKYSLRNVTNLITNEQKKGLGIENRTFWRYYLVPHVSMFYRITNTFGIYFNLLYYLNLLKNNELKNRTQISLGISKQL